MIVNNRIATERGLFLSLKYTLISHDSSKVGVEYKYDVFGKAYIRGGKSENWREFKESKIDNTIPFTGREYDKEIKLYYYRARYYDAELGGFISRDPIAQVDDINLYAYVGNNPVMFGDQKGKAKELLFNVFNNAISDLSQYQDLGFFDKFDKWKKLNLGEYDLVYTKNKEENSADYKVTKLNPEGIIDVNYEKYINLTTKQIILGGNSYSIGEVSNILVGFNAYNIGYSLDFLNAGGMAWTLKANISGDGSSNGLQGEYADQALYDAGYNLANTISSGQSFSMDMFLYTIKTGTENRQTRHDNYMNIDIIPNAY